MRLYYMPGSCALSCHIALEWAGVDYDAERLSMEDIKSEAFLEINPKGKVPALQIDGEVLTEAAAILIYIAEARPQADLVPDPGLPRGKLLEALSELTSEFHPSFAPLFVPERFVDDENCHDSAGEAARRSVGAQFARWEQRMLMRDWITGQKRSVADSYLYVMCRWSARIDRSLSDWPGLAAFAGKMERDGGVLSALSQQGLDPIRSGS